MVKLFIGNLPREATEQEIRSLFEQYGRVLECDIIKNYGFVHIEDKTAAEDAIRNLHHYKLHGVCINVEASKNKSKASTKLHVGNISTTCTNIELRSKFEEYGSVLECDIVKDYAFVHMERAEDAVEAIRGLDNTEFQACLERWLESSYIMVVGKMESNIPRNVKEKELATAEPGSKRMRVQLSTSRLRTAPGMGDKSGCYRCGKEGHWSKECPVDRTGQVPELTETYSEQYGMVRTPYPAGYGDPVYYDDPYGMVDYYKRYRARSAAAYGASAYDAYAEHTMAQYSQYAQYSQATAMANRLSTALDPYERALLPTSGTAAAVAAAAAAATTSFYTRDRSPLRRPAAMASTAGDVYGYERVQLSPVPRSSLYDVQRFGRDAGADRLRYSAY